MNHKTSRQKTFFRWGLGLTTGLLLVLLLAWTLQATLLRLLAEHRIHRETGLETRIEQLEVKWRSDQFLVKNLRLINPPETGHKNLARIAEIRVHLDRQAATQGRLHLTELRLNIAELNVVRMRDGRLNIAALMPKPGNTNSPARRPAKPSESPEPKQRARFSGIDHLVVSLGKITYSDLRHPERHSELDLGIAEETVHGLKSFEEVNQWLAALMIRVAINEYLKDPAKSRTALLDLLFQGLTKGRPPKESSEEGLSHNIPSPP